MTAFKYLVVDKTNGATIQGCDNLSEAITLVAELLREGRHVGVVNTTKSKEDTMKKQLYKIAFTGHRPPKIGGYDDKNPLRVAVKDAIAAVLDRAVAKYSETHQVVIISGGALGVDQDAARVAHKMGLPFIVAAPCRNQDSKWPKQSQERYKKMLGLAMDVVYVHDGPYRDGCLNKRNEWMIDHCDALVAVWDGSPGGTAHCVKYARSAGKPIVMVNPNNLKEVK